MNVRRDFMNIYIADHLYRVLDTPDLKVIVVRTPTGDPHSSVNVLVTLPENHAMLGYIRWRIANGANWTTFVPNILSDLTITGVLKVTDGVIGSDIMGPQSFGY